MDLRNYNIPWQKISKIISKHTMKDKIFRANTSEVHVSYKYLYMDFEDYCYTSYKEDLDYCQRGI